MSFASRKFSTLKRTLTFSKDDENETDDYSEDKRSTIKARLRSKTEKRRASKLTTGTVSTTSDEDFDDVDTTPRTHRVSNLGKKSKSMIPMFSEMPSPAEVEVLLAKTLDDLALPEASKRKFKDSSIEEKWKVVQMHQNYVPRRSEANLDQQSATYWIRKLAQKNSKGRPRLSPEDALKMKSVFRTAHKDFITNFLEQKGVSLLNKVTLIISSRARRDKKEATVLASLIDCYRLLMNTEIGMNGVIIIPRSVKAIAMAMDLEGNDTDITEKVMLLLSVMCWWDDKGRVKVMEAMRYIKRRHLEISSFQTIVYLFEHTSNPTFKASVATFITTVCNTPTLIEERVGVRNLFLRLDIVGIFQKILTHAPEGAIEEDESWQTINTQYQVFVTMMRQDQEEVVDKLMSHIENDDPHLDLANLKDSWKLLQRSAFKADCHLELLNLLQSLLLIPTVQELAVPIYESITKFIYEATIIDHSHLHSNERIDFAKEPVMNFEELGILLKRKMEYTAKMETFSEKEGIVKRLRKLVGVLQKRLIDVASGIIPPEEATDLQEDLIKNRLLNPKARKEVTANIKKAPTTFALSTSADVNTHDININFLAGIGLMDTAGEVEILKEREAKMKAEIDMLQKKVEQLERGAKAKGSVMPFGAGGARPKPNVHLDSTGLEPAGTLPGVPPVPPADVPKAGMPGSLENAPLVFNPNAPRPLPKAPTNGPGGPQAAALAAIAARGQGGPIKQKPKKQEGGLAGLFAARAKQAQKPKNNKAEKYQQALKKLGLPDKKPIKPTIKMTQIFWKVIAPDALEGTIWPELSDQGIKYDNIALEEMFGKKEAAKRITKQTSKNTSDVVKLIDGKRRQNLAIALRKLKLDYTVIKKAIVEVNMKIITMDSVTLLLKAVPTPDERTLIDKYLKDDGDPARLPLEEQFLYVVLPIPNLNNRLKCFQTFFKFAPDARRVHTVIVRMKAAIKEINNSQGLREILQVVLAIGNYMNGGSARGSAWGFKLDILSGLSNVKAANNSTLMHFLYILFEQHYPHLCEFSLPASAQVLDVSFKETVKDMNVLAKSIAALKLEIKKKPFSKADKLKKTFSSFEVKATRDCEKLQEILEKTRRDFHNLALKFAEKGNDVEPKTFFQKLTSFERDLKNAGAQVIQMREREARSKMQEEKKKERLAYRKLKLLVEKTKDDNGEINMGLVEMYRKSQTGMPNEVIDRFLEKYNRDKSTQTMRVRQSMRIQKRRRNGPP